MIIPPEQMGEARRTSAWRCLFCQAPAGACHNATLTASTGARRSAHSDAIDNETKVAQQSRLCGAGDDGGRGGGRHAPHARHRGDLCPARLAKRSPVRRAVPVFWPALHYPHAPRAGRGLYGARRRARHRQAGRLCRGARAGIPEFGRGLGHLHEIRDQTGIVKRLVDYAGLISRPQDASKVTAAALRTMQTGRLGPAAIECAMDVWSRSAPVAVHEPLPIPAPKIDTAAIRCAAKRLGASERVLIVCGGGAQDAAAEVTTLSKLLQAPVL